MEMGFKVEIRLPKKNVLTGHMYSWKQLSS
ncbi:hypothetical protein AAKU64_004395 [Undibacterium sp. GrIS 1.8]